MVVCEAFGGVLWVFILASSHFVYFVGLLVTLGFCFTLVCLMVALSWITLRSRCIACCESVG